METKSLPFDCYFQNWFQIYSILSVCIGAFTTAASFSWSSPTIPILISNSSHIPNVTLEEASYFSVISAAFTIVGTPLTSILTELIGRKKVILLMSIPQGLAWVLIATTNNLTYLYISRILCGLADTVVNITVPTYIGEIATPSVRGSWGNLLIILLYFGQFLINVIGAYYDIVTTAVIFLCVPIAHFILVMFVPESPYYLLAKNKVKEAEKSLQILRWSNNVRDELNSLSNDVKRQTSESGTLKDVFMDAVNRKALIICIVLRLSQHFSGISAFCVYTQYIFSLAGSNLSASTGAIIYTGICLGMSSVYAFVADKFGRRYMLIVSSIGCTFALLVESVYFYIRFETQIDLSNVNWIPLAGMVLYVIASTCGIGLLPHLITGELFSANVKSKAVGVVNINVSLGMIIAPKLFQVLSEYVGPYLPFLVFAVCTFLTLIFCFLYVPETKGKTLEEIQQILMHKNEKASNQK
ncbi:hypothetical protein FQR65_LT09454 [Abscondita terminalis]|nr:hypothetical protein FQR65_LT09454 [Abscondita terminalis]